MPELDGPLAPLVAFGRDLRARGLPVGTGRILTFCRAVGVLGLTDRGSLYWAGRATLVASRADIETYDEAFDAWYRSLGAGDAELMIELQLPVSPPEADRAAGGSRDHGRADRRVVAGRRRGRGAGARR